MLAVSTSLPLTAHNGGLFVSRGKGTHPDRIITSYELILVRTGVLAIQEENTPFHVGVGEALILFPHRRHFGIAPYDPDLSFYWFHFDLPQEIEATDAPCLPLPQYVRASGNTDAWMALARRFLDIQANAEDNSTFRRSLLLLEMLVEIASVAGKSAPIMANTAGARLADSANALLHVRFAEADLSTQGIAELLAVNPDYLGRVFRRTFGKPLTDALHEYRLRYARGLLLDDSKNIAEIARASGFSDVGYFRRLFKRHNAISPQGFRRLHARTHINTE